MEEISIRLLTKNDYLDVLELEKQVHKIHYQNRPDLYNDVSELFPEEYFDDIISDENGISLGVEIDGKIVAIILSSIKETNNLSVVRKRKYCYIDDIIVDEDFKRKGYAKKLFFELKEKLKVFGVTDIELTVYPFNKEALAFYESIGMSVKSIRYELKNNIQLNTESVELITTQSVK